MNKRIEAIKYYMRDCASKEFRKRYMFNLAWDMEYYAIQGGDFDPEYIIKDALKHYLKMHPEEYNPVFEDLFTKEEITILSQSLRR